MKNRFLVDTNFLITLVLSTHPHHSVAKDFFLKSEGSECFCVCRSVQISFLRLLTQKIDPNYNPLSNAEAIVEYEQLMQVPNFEYIAESEKLIHSWLTFGKHRNPAPHLWMDAYLAYFARINKIPIVTFDKGFLQWEKQGLKVILLK